MGCDIAERLLDLAAETIRIEAHMPNEPSSNHVGLQLVKAASGAGANYEEARAAESRRDFVHKIGIAAKEAREAAYWLALIQRCEWAHRDITATKRLADEISAVLCASARTARANEARSSQPRSNRR